MDGLQIAGLAQLACRMAQEGRFSFVRGDAAAVVRHAQKGHAAVVQLDGDVLCAGVDGVFDQLLGGTGRTLHHLAGGDHIRHLGRKLLNLWHKASLLSKGTDEVFRK